MALREFARLGQIAGASRLRIVRPGADLLNPAYGDLCFDSAFSALRLRASGSVSWTQSGFADNIHGTSRSVSWPDEGYIPLVLLSIHSPTTGRLRQLGTNISGGGYRNNTDVQVTSIYGWTPGYYPTIMPYMFYDETSGNGGYDKSGVDALVTRTGMSITQHFQGYSAGMTYTSYYYVFAVGG